MEVASEMHCAFKEITAMERSNRNEICHGSIHRNESAVETTSEMDEGSRLEMKGNKVHKQHSN